MTLWTKIVTILSVAMLGLVWVAPVGAQTVVPVAEDTYIDGWGGPDWAAGAPPPDGNENWVCAGIYEEGRTRIGLLKFNLPTDLPIIQSAKLSLQLPLGTVWGMGGVSSYIVETMSNEWSETTATANSAWPLIAPLWADGICLDSKEISEDSQGTAVEWNVTSAIQAAGAGATISFYLAIDHYKPMVSNAWSTPTKEYDAFYGTNLAPTLVITGDFPGTLTGYLTLDDWNMTNVANTPAKIEFVPTSGGEAKTAYPVQLDPNNINFNYTVSNIVPGTYNVYYSASHWLRKLVSGVVITSGNTTTRDVTLVNGDLNGDNAVTSADVGILLVNLDR